jgi:drug/metabolite transporter (DMT)-like permease
MILAALCFASSPTITRIAYLNGLKTGTIIFDRFLCGALFYLIIILITKKQLRLTYAQFSVLSVLGILSAVSSICINTAYRYLTSGLASLLGISYFLPVVAVETLLKRERMTLNKMICLIASVAGICIILISPDDVNKISRFGVCIAIISSLLSASIVMSVSSKLLNTIDPLVIIFYLALPAAAINLILNLVQGIPLMPNGTEQWIPVIIVTVLNAFIGQVSFYVSIRLIGGGNGSLIDTVEVLFSAVLGIIVLNDNFTLPVIIGGTLILTSIILLGMDLKKMKP